ncbi:CDGSH iron-sulfur domain-containing protein [Streptomyces spirodelae]|uniref:CDGSH iron-sulfur domain-containing protein n=1 Tax=Streptomyces spirodelae TaxID=2812904 RepID=UPI0027DE4E89|nr:CDGSH iron-sulfur domain-containing protein [Streptomyces spirodelae]
MPTSPDEQPPPRTATGPGDPREREPRPEPHSEPRRDRRRVTLEQGGPVLVEGPVEVRLDDGSTVVSDRFMTALCTCRRSRTYPWCDTSHRRRSRPA